MLRDNGIRFDFVITFVNLQSYIRSKIKRNCVVLPRYSQGEDFPVIDLPFQSVSSMPREKGYLPRILN